MSQAVKRQIVIPKQVPAEQREAQRTEAQHPRLRVIPGTKGRQRKLLMPAICGATAAAFGAAQMVLSNMTSEGAYQLRALETQYKDTVRVERVLEQNSYSLQSPQNLAVNAQSLGMVQNVSPAYLRLSDGVILGNPDVTAETVVSNTVANATLSGLPALNGIDVPGAPAAAAAGAVEAPAPEVKPVPWEGELPAPATH